MTKMIKLKSPKFFDELETIVFSDLDTYDLDKIQNYEINNQPFTLEKNALTIDSCKFTNVIFSESTFPRIDLIDAVFKNCDLSNVSFSGGSIERVEFIDCKLIGTRFDQRSLKEVLFQNSNSKYANFSFSKFRNINFSDCNIIDGVFQESKLDKVIFDNCDLSNSYFNKTLLNKIDFTTCHITGINVDIEKIVGMKVTPLQALDLTRLLGIIVQ